MKRLSISISDEDYLKFGFTNPDLMFLDFLDIIGKRSTILNLDKVLAIADKCGLSDMTMDDINSEVAAVRTKPAER